MVRKKLLAILLVFVLGSSIMGGCSKNGVSAQVNDKLELAVKYLSEQKYEEAILAYQEVIKIDTKNVTAYKGISLAYVLQEKRISGTDSKGRIESSSQDISLQLAMAGLMVDQGKNEQAEAIYQGLIEGDASTISVYQAYRLLLRAAGQDLQPSLY